MIRRIARGLKARVTSWFQAPEVPFRPDFDDEVFVEGLSAEFLEKLGDARLDPKRQRVAILSHFRARPGPAFFLAPHELREIAAGLAKTDPDYVDELVGEGRRQATERFQVYEQSYPGLAAGFRWEELRRGEGHDVLHLERPQRFGFAPVLGLASLWDKSASDALFTIIRSWMAYSAQGDSFAYASNLVVLYRILALHWTFVLLCGAEDRGDSVQDLQYEILKILQVDTRYLATRAGESVANNHLLADGFGAWYVGSQFPEFLNADDWRDLGETLWLRELDRQIYADGTNFEHSVHYHELACEMAITYLLLHRRNGIEPPKWAEARVRKMYEFRASCNGPHDVVHFLGDTIEDPLLPLQSIDIDAVSQFREIHDALYPPFFESAEPGRRARGRALWLMSSTDVVERASAIDASHTESYPLGGYFFFSENDGDARLLFRTGPAPDQEVFGGHMHCDFLSIFLAVGSNPLIVEAGTYTYRVRARVSQRSSERWRSFFLGPGSHNGLVLDEPDPLGPVTGDFRNRRQAARVRSHWKIGPDVLAWVEGCVEQAGAYSGHRRGVLHVPGEYVVIYDALLSEQIHASPYLRFQLAPGSTLDQSQPGTVIIANGGVAAGISYSSDRVGASVVQGSDESGMGWVSDRYGSVRSSPCLVFDFKTGVDSNVFVLKTHTVDSGIEVSHDTLDGGLVIGLTHRHGVDRLLVSTPGAGITLRSGRLELDGGAAWVRTLTSGHVEVRAVDVSRFTDGEIEITNDGGRRADVVHVVSGHEGLKSLSRNEPWTRVRLRNEQRGSRP